MHLLRRSRKISFVSHGYEVSELMNFHSDYLLRADQQNISDLCTFAAESGMINRKSPAAKNASDMTETKTVERTETIV
jgi:hypothetical protein